MLVLQAPHPMGIQCCLSDVTDQARDPFLSAAVRRQIAMKYLHSHNTVSQIQTGIETAMTQFENFMIWSARYLFLYQLDQSLEHMFILYFFFEHAEELCIIVLSRRKRKQMPQYKKRTPHTHLNKHKHRHTAQDKKPNNHEPGTTRPQHTYLTT
jgi:hypothetical protein